MHQIWIRNTRKEDTMKRILAFVAMAALVLGTVATASAELDVKAAGNWQVYGNVWSNKADFDDGDADNREGFTAAQRARTQLRFTFNENVMAELYTEYGTHFWGEGPAAYGEKGSLNIKRAFIQFRLPDTDVLFTAGEQDITFPHSGAFSNMVLGGEDAGALVVSAPITDMVGLTLAYTRLVDTFDRTDTPPASNPSSGTNADAFLAAVPVTLDGMTIAPWFAYGLIGENSGYGTPAEGDNSNAWWAGAGFNMDLFDPIVVYADFVYGSADEGFVNGDDSSGFLVDAMVEYKGLDLLTPQVFFAYSSQNDDGDGALPFIQSDWGIGGTLINGSSFGAGDVAAAEPGFWLAGVAARDISFIEKLSHDVIFLYAKGTGDTAGFGPAELTSDDSYMEIDFNTQYQIYESLAAIVELAYAKPDFDDSSKADDALMKASFGFVYKF